MFPSSCHIPLFFHAPIKAIHHNCRRAEIEYWPYSLLKICDVYICISAANTYPGMAIFRGRLTEGERMKQGVQSANVDEFNLICGLFDGGSGKVLK